MKSEGLTIETAREESGKFVKLYDGLVVDGPVGWDLSGQALLDIKARKEKIVKLFKPLKEAANKAHKLLTAQERECLEDFVSADTRIRALRVAYKTEQDRIADEKQREAEAEERAKRKAEQERLMEKAANTEDVETQDIITEHAEAVTEQPVFVEKVVKKSSVIPGGGSSTFIKDIAIENIVVKDICASVANGVLPPDVVEIKPGKIKAWAKSYGITPGQKKGFLIRETSRESIRRN